MSLVSCGEIRQVFYPVFNEHFPKRDVQVSATNAEGPPVPIPNTEVKLCSAEDTRSEATRKNRSGPTFFFYLSAFLAQLVRAPDC